MNESKTIEIEGIKVLIKYKKIRNINLKVNIKKEVSLSVPNRIKDQEIEKFIISKIDWIKKSLEKYSKNSEEGFYYLGQKYKVKQLHCDLRTPKVEVGENDFIIHLHEGIPEKTKNRLLDKHFENDLIAVTREFFEKWEKTLGVSKNSLTIQKMKGKWGYCNTRNSDICLNLELIKKDLKFIEYVVLHELCHILVPNHGFKFKVLLNKYMPNWKNIVKEYSL